MNLIKVAAGVVNQTPLAWELNKTNIINCIEEAKENDISLLCLPELSITGYGCEDMFYAPSTIESAIESLLDIVEHCSSISVCVGLPIQIRNHVYNAACLISNKQIRGFVCKKNLANNGIHYETRWFQPWPAAEKTELRIGEFSYPVGDLIFEIGGAKIGFEICEDAWVANRPGKDLYLQGCDIILNPSASHFSFFKSLTRERLVQEGSRAFGCAYIYTNLLGNESGRAIFDGDAVIAQCGELLSSGTRFSYKNHYLTEAILDLDKIRLEQSQNRLIFKSTPTITSLFDFPAIKYQANHYQLENWEAKGHQKEEEFARAVALGLMDYLRKSKSEGWVISLSGGADSSAIVSLCYISLALAVKEIGIEGVKNKLAYIKKIQHCQDLSQLAHQLIITVYQGTENSSDATKESANSLANSLNATFYDININDLVSNYTALIEKAIGQKLSWQENDISLQNIQARVRSPSAWLLANLNNALLLATSNRSEASVGYATMDGDTSGSISPIAGVDKHWLRQWLKWLENNGLEESITIKGLHKMNSLEPTAELRPLDKKQVDEDDLMPYDFLNDIETLAIKDKKTPIDCYEILSVNYSDIYSNEKMALWIEKFFTLFARNQWKRERYAPGFHVDDRNLDPRSWLRFPILSGGFHKEISDMKAFVNNAQNNKRKGKIGF
ncbi:MAG: NAD(+) synthase [Pseudarcicella sp.]|nr:NAD(+) synthase [Pseudarcicella sp.]